MTSPTTAATQDQTAERVKQGARRMATSIEIRDRRREALAIRRPDHIAIKPVDSRPHPDTGRQQLAVDPTLAVLGRYLRRSRRYLEVTQMQLAERSGLSQSMISRAERGVAPAMSIERFVILCAALGRLFPLGSCPHDHDCAWEPIRPINRSIPDPTAFLAYLLKTAGDT